MSNDSIAVHLALDADKYIQGFTKSESATKRFVNSAKSEFNELKGVLGSTQGLIASLGVSISAVAITAQSARMDKSLAQIGLTAGVSSKEILELRKQLFELSVQTGQSVDDLQSGFGTLIASGEAWKAARQEIEAINVAIGVTGSKAETLAGALSVSGQAFNFDLSKPGQALDILDKMTVAGRQGNAELENLSDIFAKVGVNSAKAGMGFEQSLAFIEGLSLIERQPERLGTLVDSTLRIFNNKKYMDDAQQATGVKFFDKKGMRRDAFDVLDDIRAKYQKLTTDVQRSNFIDKAFGKADLDTVRGLQTLLSGSTLETAKRNWNEIGHAGGTLKKDLDTALNNSVDQVGRLKNALRDAADSFAQPLNDTLSQLIKWSMDSKANGGLGLDGKDMLGYGAAGVAGTWAISRYGGKALEKLFSKGGNPVTGMLGKIPGMAAGLAQGVGTGKALQAAAGVTPVFVVNMPDSLTDNLPSVPPVPELAAQKSSWLTAALPWLKGASVPLAATAAVNFTTSAEDEEVLYGDKRRAALRAKYGQKTIDAARKKYQPWYQFGEGSALESMEWTRRYMADLYPNSGKGGVLASVSRVAASNLQGKDLSKLPPQALSIAGRLLGQQGGDALAKAIKQSNIGGTITIKVDGPGQVVSVKPNNPSTKINVYAGQTMQH